MCKGCKVLLSCAFMFKLWHLWCFKIVCSPFSIFCMPMHFDVPFGHKCWSTHEETLHRVCTCIQNTPELATYLFPISTSKRHIKIPHQLTQHKNYMSVGKEKWETAQTRWSLIIWNYGKHIKSIPSTKLKSHFVHAHKLLLCCSTC